VVVEVAVVVVVVPVTVVVVLTVELVPHELHITGHDKPSEDILLQ